jgi:hypothetical protein
LPSQAPGELPNGKLRTFRLDGTRVTGPGHAAGSAAYGVSSHARDLFTAYGKLVVAHRSGDVTEQSTVSSAQHIILKP